MSGRRHTTPVGQSNAATTTLGAAIWLGIFGDGGVVPRKTQDTTGQGPTDAGARRADRTARNRAVGPRPARDERNYLASCGLMDSIP